jgi:ABC-type amino acid transport substrate-binding protein
MTKALATLAAFLVAPAAMASPDGGKPGLPPGGGGPGPHRGHTGTTNINSSNNAANSQSSSGVINQSPVGGVNSNTQYNESTATDYGFGGGIFCRGATLNVAGFGSNASGFGSSASNLGGLVGISIPLNTEVARTCRELAREVTTQRQLDTCLTLLRAGVVADPAIWPELERCPGLSLVQAPAPAPAPPAPAPTPAPVQQGTPVRGLW